MSVGLSSQPLSGFRVELEPISISAASVKVVGVTRPVRNHTFSPLLALIFSLPRSQRSWDRGSSPTMEGLSGVCFSSLCTVLCDSVKSSARPLGAPVSFVSGASGSGNGRFGGSASGRGFVEPASGAVTTSGSVRASSSYLITIQRL